jgi:hypothetical protein
MINRVRKLLREPSLTPLQPSSDDGISLVAWGSAETATTIMAASIPMLRVLVRGSQPLSPELRFGSRAAYILSLPASARERARRDLDFKVAPGPFKPCGECQIEVNSDRSIRSGAPSHVELDKSAV